MLQNSTGRNFLFLQGPISPFFSEIAKNLSDRGHTTWRINLCFGDRLFWNHENKVNYRKSLNEWPIFVENFIKEKMITDLVLLGEQRDYHKMAIAAAHRLNVNIVVTDFGYIRPDWIAFEKNGMSGESQFPKDPEQIREIALRSAPFDGHRRYQDSFFGMASRDIMYHILTWLLTVTHPRYRSHQIHHPVLVYAGTGIRLLKGRLWRARRANKVIREVLSSDTPFFVFPLQMATDFQIRAYSPFDGLEEPIAIIVDSFSEHAPLNSRLVIKLHPLDPGLQDWRKIIMNRARDRGVSGRILFIDGGSLDDMLRGARGVVTINSTVGLTALRLSVPVHTLGTAIYDVVGLVDPQPLAQFWTRPAKPDDTLCRDFVRAIAASLHVRGVFYSRPGLTDAVKAAADRLHYSSVNQPIQPESERMTTEICH